MMNKKINVFTTFDTNFNTWNVMKSESECIFYGSIDEMEAWLNENQECYQELDGIPEMLVA